jgi:hypothetical protein
LGLGFEQSRIGVVKLWQLIRKFWDAALISEQQTAVLRVEPRAVRPWVNLVRKPALGQFFSRPVFGWAHARPLTRHGSFIENLLIVMHVEKLVDEVTFEIE